MIIDNITMPDLPWSNEFKQSPHAVTKEYASNGALFIEVATKQAGLSVVLSDPDTWFSRAQLLALQQHQQTKNGSFQLTLGTGQQLSVMWDYEGAPIDATPLRAETDPDMTSIYLNVTLRFITV